jgi:hypothetical protein
VSAPFAFTVAVDQVTEDPDGFAGYYDAQKQEFVWEGGRDATLGSPVCSASYIPDPWRYHHCRIEGMTSCSVDTPCNPLYGCYGYTCDYG